MPSFLILREKMYAFFSCLRWRDKSSGRCLPRRAMERESTVSKTTAFKVFDICNNIALFTSLPIVILLVSIIPYKRIPLKRLLVATHRMMWVSIGFMATAYVAASWVTRPYYHGTRWLFPAIVSVAGGASAVLFSYLAVETIGHWFKKKSRVGDIPSFARTISDLAISGKSGYFAY